MATSLETLLSLPFEERLRLATALWSSIEQSPANVPIPGWQLELLSERIATDDEGADPGDDWAVVRLRIETGS